MTTTGWTCRVCWQRNRWRDDVCWRCKSEPDVRDDEVEARRKARQAAEATRATRAEAVPDAVVAIPVIVFRAYSRIWRRGGLALLGLLALMVFGGVTDVVWLALTIGFAVGLFAFGMAAGEIVEGMRNREAWAFVLGIALAVVGGIGSVLSFSLFAPDLISPTAVRWASGLLFGGAALAAAAGLVMLLRNQLPRR